jgi:hypothetical protein
MEHKNLQTKIGAIQQELTVISKNKKIGFQGGYGYVTEEQIYDVLKPLLSKNKVTITISDEPSSSFFFEYPQITHSTFKTTSPDGKEEVRSTPMKGEYLVRFLKKAEIWDDEDREVKLEYFF